LKFVNLDIFKHVLDHVSKTGSVWVNQFEPLTEGQACAKKFLNKCLKPNQTSWRNVSLEEFISCPSNLAFNRQARMLAVYDSNFSMCNYLSNRKSNPSLDNELLARAKQGLDSLLFFGMCEQPFYSRLLFQYTFRNLKFDNILSETVMSSKSSWKIHHLDREMVSRIEALNQLDIELFKYGFDLFIARLNYFNIRFIHSA
jgi:hypothetical protein